MRRLLPLFLPALAMAQENSVSLQGYTGLLNIPNAFTAPDGTLTAFGNNQVDPRFRVQRWSQQTGFTAGFLPFAESTLSFVETPGAVGGDLSMSFKAQLPGLPEWFPRIALGAQDVGGAAAHFRTRYAVATQRLGGLDLSLGYGHGPDRLKGVFGGAEWRAASWLHLLAEHDTSERNVGLRLGAPSDSLPWGLDLRLITKWSLDAREHRLSIAGTLRVPFDLGRSRKRQAVTTASASVVPVSRPQAVREDRLDVLVPRLVALGFENVRVGHVGRTLRVEVENNRFNHNALDGLGVALGCATQVAGAGTEHIQLILRKKALQVVAVDAPLEALQAFFLAPEGERSVAAGRLAGSLQLRPAEAQPEASGMAWNGPRANPSRGHTSLILQPGLTHTVGTEVGRLDYQTLLRVGTLTQFWAGATLELGTDIPLARTDDFRPGGAFAHQAIPSTRLQRALFSQALPLAPGLITQFGGGLYHQGVKAAFNETQWRSPEGTHRFSFLGGLYREDKAADRRVALGSYRFHYAPLDATFEATAGTFYNQDRGYRLEARRWFRDVSLRLFFTHTNEKLLGFALGLPLTPRRDLRPGWLNIRGSEHWVDSLSTVVQRADGSNPVTFGMGSVPVGLDGLSRSLYDQDRLGEAYLKANLLRLREAFLTWGANPAPGS